MSSQFDYLNIYNAELEKCAYQHHIGWVEIEKRIYIELNDEEKKKSIEQYESDKFITDERK